ncbi:hypothetical protein DNTS_023808 [Danionella cerebrum]|uniref:Major facilitator superfamily (MFS) profile domain-containing protein n=1 Tax=Danionella cerebrum TaxID=2873325 RepID=A0A553NJN3_9TELE|nr:hypothetical protein DNTS_023808 [Danionella translucida]TRY65623.1 hypothetical protein DNTS_023808 [Danionella translucida]TRY65624.1 hypothetical protein DNTS_023808 [Danionella translucida]
MGTAAYGYYRTVIFISMFVGYMLYYFNRKTFSFLMPSVMEEIDLDKEDLDQRPLALLHRPFHRGNHKHCLLWLLHRHALHTALWFEPSQFGTWWAVLCCSMNLAGSLGPILTTLLVQYYHWRTIMSISGVICMAVSIVCLIMVKNEPSEVGLPNIEPGTKKNEMGGSSYMSALEVGGFFGSIGAARAGDIWQPSPCAAPDNDGRHGCVHVPLPGHHHSGESRGGAAVGFSSPSCVRPLRSLRERALDFDPWGCVWLFVIRTDCSLWSDRKRKRSLQFLRDVSRLGAFVAGLPFSTIAKHYSWDTAFWVAEVSCAVTTICFFFLRNMRTKMGRVCKKMN